MILGDDAVGGARVLTGAYHSFWRNYARLRANAKETNEEKEEKKRLRIFHFLRREHFNREFVMCVCVCV